MAEKPIDGRQGFIQGLNEEARLIQQFVDLLLHEQKALSAGDTDVLPKLADDKSGLAAQLNRIAEDRGRMLVAMGFSADRAGVEAWCAGHPEEKVVAAAWAGVLELAREAKELNRLNGELIALRMQHNARALEALRSGNNPLDLYGPDGQAQPPNRVRINDSV